ncbi:MAG: FadR/GntR family transcriptional regulator [Desulfobacula sp.]|jgi:DNA-binding FadR family transcriptional regulator|nr:FadR/GntR family transcriptional regulator [Desulfobacula sp.]
MDTVFKKIKPQKISEEIAGQIRDLIKDGKLQPGEKLPPERIFSEMLGVGRSSLREAINILETQGFVEIKKRMGIYVCSLSKSIISDPLRKIIEEDKKQLLHLYEVRNDIELASAFAAAQHRTKEDLEKMKQCLEKMETDAKNSLLSLYDDLDFHLAIAQSGHNIFRSHILKNIFDISDDHLQYVMGIMIGENPRLLKLLEQHQNIFAAIEQHDPPMARTMMAEHLIWVEQQWKTFMQERSNSV